MLYLSLDWVTIFSVFYFSLKYFFIAPVFLLLLGSRQRALSNLIHDASHWNLTRNKKLNDWIIDFLGGLPMLSPVTLYRESHLLHHKHLGHPVLDPDLKMHRRYGYDDSTPPFAEWYKNVLYLLFNFESWKDSVVGSFYEMSNKQKLQSLIWWTLFIALFSVMSSFFMGLLFTAYWIFARATTYHVVRTIAEFLDHSGLEVGSVTKNSRIIKAPHKILKYLLHPHNDNFHALHHFDPAIPQYNLAIAYKTVSVSSSYLEKIRKNDSYFLGSNAAIKDLRMVT